MKHQQSQRRNLKYRQKDEKETRALKIEGWRGDYKKSWGLGPNQMLDCAPPFQRAPSGGGDQEGHHQRGWGGMMLTDPKKKRPRNLKPG